MVLGKMTVTFPSGSEREPRLTCRRLRGRRTPSHGHGHPKKPVARGCRLVNTEARCCPARLPARGPEGLPPGPHCRRSGHAVCMRPRVHGRETDPARGLGCPRGVIFAYLFLKKVSNSLDAQPGVRGNLGPPPSERCGRFLRLLKWVGLAALDLGRVLVPRSLPGGLPPGSPRPDAEAAGSPAVPRGGAAWSHKCRPKTQGPRRVSLAAALRKGAGPAGASLLLTGVRGVPRKVLRRPLLKQGTRASFQNSSRK